jgi:hypothetical protein
MSMPSEISEQAARSICRILKEECGATDFMLDWFIPRLREESITEYRFQGNLGFGGKFWNANGRWYVTCYSEDETPERQEMIRKANERLADLRPK